MSSRTADRDTMPPLIGESEPIGPPSGAGDDLEKAPGWMLNEGLARTVEWYRQASIA